jgi:hypothetical protein
MTFIDPRHSVAAALQARLGAPGVRRRTAGPATGAAAGGGGAQRAAAALTQRIAGIARTDPDRRRKAVRVVLEAELSRAFGAGLLNDPGFPVMLDAVQDQMEHDGEVAVAVRTLGDLLLAGVA